MTFTFTLEQLILLFLSIPGLIVGIYLIVVLKNANDLILNTNDTITQNRENIASLIGHLDVLSQNMAGLSGEVKDQFVKYETMADSIIRYGAQSMLTISDVTDNIRGLIAGFSETIQMILRFFRR